MVITPHDRATTVSKTFRQIAATFSEAAESSYPHAIEAAAELILNSLERGKKLLIFGNGGSAADAQHFCGELVVRFRLNRKPLPAIALGCDGVVLTACGNDFDYDQVFARQVEALGTPGDVAFAITTSGRSPNVVLALKTAQRQGLKTILLTGKGMGPACEFADLVMAAPGSDTARVQELHLASYHMICEMIDEAFSRAL